MFIFQQQKDVVYQVVFLIYLAMLIHKYYQRANFVHISVLNKLLFCLASMGSVEFNLLNCSIYVFVIFIVCYNVSNFQTRRITPVVRQRYIVGATFGKDNSITTWFNNQPYHSPPLALQLAMNAIIKTEVSEEHSILVGNYPLPFTLNTKVNYF